MPLNEGLAALNSFAGVKRRMERRGEAGGVTVYDDFAHHPTAIASTLEGARAALDGRIIAVLEPRSNTMRMGVHRDQLAASLAAADAVFLFQPPDLDWSLEDTAQACRARASVHTGIEALIESIVANSQTGDQVIVMSNGAFAGIHTRLLEALSRRS